MASFSNIKVRFHPVVWNHMTSTSEKFPDFWRQYDNILEDLAQSRDIETAIQELEQIVKTNDPSPPIDLLLAISKIYLRFKRLSRVKRTYARILQLDPGHRQTWKFLSEMYFKEKDAEKGLFCMQKYYSLGGGNAQISSTTKKRLASTGRLKQLPSNQPLGLVSGRTVQQQSPQQTLSAQDFETRFKLDPSSLPQALRRVLNFGEHQIVDYRCYDARPGEFGNPDLNLISNPELKAHLYDKGITRLFKFQEQAFKAILKGEDVCIVAPTGNGKTEAFILPTLVNLQKYQGYGVQMVIIYPQKALAKDQLRKIENLASSMGLSVKVFDGDTSHYWRKKIYQDPPEILITNPDILHYHLGIGKNASRFQNLLSGLKIVVLDEVHTFSGTFGSNMFYILQRLERVVGQSLQYITSSATMANAQDFVSRLIQRNITLIECKNGKRGRLHFLMVAPFEGVKTLDSTVNLVNTIRQYGKTLVFQDSHRRVERMYQALGRLPKRVGIHRAGLTKKMRENVEADFREGQLDVLVATPTMELGVDIGDLTHVITPPISVNRAMQRFGRAGRKGQESLAIVVLNAEDPISNYYYQHPDQYYQDLEGVFFDPGNPEVQTHQLLCAALDLPINKDEFPLYQHVLQELVANRLLEKIGDTYLPTEAGTKQAHKHSIRGITHQITIKIREGQTIGKRAQPQAMLELHPGAIYYAAGRRYQVANFWFNGIRGGADLISPSHKWGTTSPLYRMRPKILEILNLSDVFKLETAYVETKILHSVFGYVLRTPDRIQTKNLKDPLYYTTQGKGLLFHIPQVGMQMERPAYEKAVHTVVHTLLHASLPFIGGQLQDIGGVLLLPFGYILLFDQPTGAGVCTMLQAHLPSLFERAHDLLGCTCKNPIGCPRCTFLPRCTSQNTNLDKYGARGILHGILSNVSMPLGDLYDQCTQASM
ncbi:MAG: DEAD/DEAH box helicase [Candidatus Thorarchaeota archaeon]